MSIDSGAQSHHGDQPSQSQRAALQDVLTGLKQLFADGRSLRQMLAVKEQSLILQQATGQITQFCFEVEICYVRRSRKQTDDNLRKLQAYRSLVLHTLALLEKGDKS